MNYYSSVVADEDRGTVKIFNLTPKDSFNYNHPLDVLYTIVAGAFLGNIRRPANTNKGGDGGSKKEAVDGGRGSGTWSGTWSGTKCKGGSGSGRLNDMVMPRTLPLDMREMKVTNDQRGFESVQFQYIENETLRRRFINCQKYFQDKGVPDGERLVFHGTKAENIDSIIENGLLLSMGRIMVHGYGLYFSQFPEIALKYGDGVAMVVCRVMMGRPYRGKEKGIPDGFNSKIVEEKRFGQDGRIILVDKEEQILPAFIIKGVNLKGLI